MATKYMARLERSFLKEQGRNNAFYWQSNDWQTLLAIYKEQLTTQS